MEYNSRILECLCKADKGQSGTSTLPLELPTSEQIFETIQLLRVKNVNELDHYQSNASIVIRQVFLRGSGVTLENGVKSQSVVFQQKHQVFLVEPWIFCLHSVVSDSVQPYGL